MSRCDDRCRCRLSLRIIVALLCTTMLAIVATVSLSVGHAVTSHAVRHVVLEFTLSLVRTAQSESDAFFASAASRVSLLAEVGKQNGFGLPSDAADAHIEQGSWRQKYSIPVLHVGVLSNFSDVLHGYIFDDGGSCTLQRVTPTTGRVVSYSPAGGMFPTVPSTDYVDLRTLNEPTLSPPPLGPGPDSRVASYWEARTVLIASPERKLALPLSIFADASGTLRA